MYPDRVRRLGTNKSYPKGGSEVVQAIIITTRTQQREGRTLLDSEHLRHELVGYSRKRKKDRYNCAHVQGLWRNKHVE